MPLADIKGEARAGAVSASFHEWAPMSEGKRNYPFVDHRGLKGADWFCCGSSVLCRFAAIPIGRPQLGSVEIFATVNVLGGLVEL